MLLALAHPKRSAAILVLAILLCVSSLPTALTQAVPAPADPVPSVTVLAGCTYFSSLRFTNNVPQYVTANPQYRALNFTRATCIRGGSGNVIQPSHPKSIPPIFFLRGTTVTIRRVCSTNPKCAFSAGQEPVATHDPTSSSVAGPSRSLHKRHHDLDHHTSQRGDRTVQLHRQDSDLDRGVQPLPAARPVQRLVLGDLQRVAGEHRYRRERAQHGPVQRVTSSGRPTWATSGRARPRRRRTP